MLRDVVDPKHPLVILANSINWELIEKKISPLFCANNGRPALAVRMVTGLLYLNAYNLGDKINAALSACGFNFRKLLRAIAIFFVLKMAVLVF